MGLAWQQGPLATGAIGRFLAPAPLPERCCSQSRCADGYRSRLATLDKQLAALIDPRAYSTMVGG